MLWFYYEGNDLRDLMFEAESPLLMSYLRDNFSQRLSNYQGSIDGALAAFAAEQERLETPNRLDAVKSVAKLSHLRSRLGMDVGSYEQPPAVTDSAIELLGEILSVASKRTAAWGGKFYFVYLPCRERFADPGIDGEDKHDGTDSIDLEKVRYRDRVLAIVRARGIPLVDMVPVFESHHDGLSLFPFRRSVHYTEEGNEMVAEEILRAIATHS